MIIGCGGAGKSTLARKLHAILGLELIHLDQQYWKPNWTKSTPEEWNKVVRELANKESWIMDGNYGGTMDIRIERADTIIFLNLPTFTCLSRVFLRTWKNLGKVREDMTEGCKEHFDWEFFHYLLMYKRTREKGILAKLERVAKKKQVFVFKDDREVNDFLEKLKPITS